VSPKNEYLNNVANLGGISMAEALSKVCSTIVKKRLEQHCDTITPQHCNGFIRGRGRNGSIHALKELCKKRKAKGLDSHGMHDLIKCFDELAREHVWGSMRVSGAPEK
jgi:hypothetical protein